MAWQRLHEAGKLKLQSYQDAAKTPQAAQYDLLLSIIRANANSGFGEHFKFNQCKTYREFADRVPLSDYNDYVDWIEQIKDGQLDALTCDVPFAFEETGGSSGGRKLIPYNSQLLESYQNSILSWLCDLQNNHPNIAAGPAYFAISPTTRNLQKHAGKLPIGLASDALYFGQEHVGDVAQIMLGAYELSGIRDFGTWQESTLAWLLACENLSFISIWSPTFLTTLLDAVKGNEEALLKAIQTGKHGLPSNKARSNFVSTCLKDRTIDGEKLWPNLSIISAWGDAGSARFFSQLKDQFSNVIIQPKGLLSTEGIVSFPIEDAEYPLPAFTSTFLEFESPDGEIFLLDELEEGTIYNVVMTTAGGLYRYRNQDQVLCRGYYRGFGSPLPLLSFFGRGDCILDMVGEKLEEGFVANCLQDAGTFAALCPIENPNPHYALLLEKSHTNPQRFAESVEENLSKNPLYADARQNGQLGTLSVHLIEDAEQQFIEWRLSKGHRLSDIKLPVFINKTEIADEIWRCMNYT